MGRPVTTTVNDHIEVAPATPLPSRGAHDSAPVAFHTEPAVAPEPASPTPRIPNRRPDDPVPQDRTASSRETLATAVVVVLAVAYLICILFFTLPA